MDFVEASTTISGKKRPRSDSPSGDDSGEVEAKLHKSEDTLIETSVQNGTEHGTGTSTCTLVDKDTTSSPIVTPSKGTTLTKRKRDDLNDNDDQVATSKVAKISVDSESDQDQLEQSHLNLNEPKVLVAKVEGQSRYVSIDSHQDQHLPEQQNQQSADADDEPKVLAAAKIEGQSRTMSTDSPSMSTFLPPIILKQPSAVTAVSTVLNDISEATIVVDAPVPVTDVPVTDMPVTKSEEQNIKSTTAIDTNRSIPHETPTQTTSSQRTYHVKVMSILIGMFFFNIITTFTVLAALFITPDNTTVKSVASLLILNMIFTHTLTIQLTPTPKKTTSVSLDRHHPHIIPPRYLKKQKVNNDNHDEYISNVTLRQFLADPQGFHLGFSPSFFGFYAYFGALTSFQENVLSSSELEKGFKLLPEIVDDKNNNTDAASKTTTLLKSVAGASSGAMAAVLLASGLNPRESAEFASTMTLSNFADPVGIGSILRGDLFEEIMADFLREAKIKGKKNSSNGSNGSDDKHDKMDSDNDNSADEVTNFQLEEGLIPVAVTVFDLLSMKTRVLRKGCAARASRASACFPVLFQPVNIVGLDDDDNDDDGAGTKNKKSFFRRLKNLILPETLCIDGGVLDSHGLLGLAQVHPEEERKRIVNVVAGTFGRGGELGPMEMPAGVDATEVLSISIENTPLCGPHNMANGPRAVEAAMNAINAVLDVPMHYGKGKNHFILNIDAEAFVPPLQKS